MKNTIKVLLVAVLAVLTCTINTTAQATAPCADPAVKEQKAMFRTISATGRAEVMRLHVAELYKAPTTTPAQKAVLRKLIPFITTEVYTDPTAPKPAELLALLSEADQVFKGTEAFARFSPAAAGLLKAKAEGLIAKVRARMNIDCSCSYGSNYCGSCENGNTRPCTPRMLNCTESSWGCGTLMMWPCDGGCDACKGTIGEENSDE